MADTTQTKEDKISIKVIVDKVGKRVVYAEADCTFVDILFSFMTLPLGTIARLLAKLDDTKFEAFRSLNNLYESLKDFPECYLSTPECKSLLLNPRSLFHAQCRRLKQNIDDTEPIKYFVCRKCWYGSPKDEFFSICDKAICRRCGNLMNSLPLSPNGCVRCCPVFVSETATYIVTDDLCVMPYTSTTSIQLLTDLGITDMSHLEGRSIDMDREQMLYLLKVALSIGSLLSNTVFGRNQPFKGLDGPSQGMTFDPCDIMKKETSTTASSKMLLEVSLQKSTGQVLFAEVKEDFLDFLFGFLSIPLGTAIGTLMNGNSSLSCLDNLLKSISNMSVDRYFQSQDIKDKLLKPYFAQNYTSKNHIFPLNGTGVTRTLASGITCARTCTLKDPRIEDGYLKKSGMFIVTDDLVIAPSSSISTMDILNKFKVKLNDIERHELNIGLEEGLRILKASMLSRSTFTNLVEHQLKK